MGQSEMERARFEAYSFESQLSAYLDRTASLDEIEEEEVSPLEQAQDDWGAWEVGGCDECEDWCIYRIPGVPCPGEKEIPMPMTEDDIDRFYEEYRARQEEFDRREAEYRKRKSHDKN